MLESINLYIFRYKMEGFSCPHWELSTTNFRDKINHNLEIHEEKNLKIKISKFDSQRKETISYKKNFQIIPKYLKLSNRTLPPNDDTKTVRVSSLYVDCSPHFETKIEKKNTSAFSFFTYRL